MIRESAANWTRTVYRPLRRAGQRTLRKPVANPTRMRQPERYPVLDHARFLLIALVVVGHLLEQLADSGPFAAALYRWIYLFHMPAFVLVSGAVSKATLTNRRVLAIVTGLLFPYLVFQTLYPAWDAWLFHSDDWSQDYLTPYWLLWYLPSLACWRLLLPLFARLKFALPLAVAMALAAGMAPWIGYPLSLSRTLVFFPLFLLGYLLGARRLQHLGVGRVRKVVAVMILLAAAVGAWCLRDVDPEWLYASSGYADLNVAPFSGAATRLLLLTASALCALSVLTLLPRHARHASALGRRSLTAYLVHGFLVRALIACGAFTLLAGLVAPWAALLLCLAGGAGIATLLSTRWADRMAAPLTRPAAWLAGLPRVFGGLAIRLRMEQNKRLY